MIRIAVLALIWGWSFFFIKIAVEGMTPPTVAAGRMAFGLVVMLAFLRARRVALPRRRADWGHFAVMGVVASGIPFTLLAWGEQHISSALTSVLNAATPLFTAVAAAPILGERLRVGQIAGLLVGFAGVAVAAGLGGADVAGSSLGGSLAAVGAAACYGLTFVYARRTMSHLRPMVSATGQLVVGTLVFAPLAVITSLDSGISLEPHRVLSVMLLGALGTGVAYVLYYQAITDLGPTRASVVTYLIPVVAVLVGVVFLDEPFELRLVAGGGLTIVGIALLHERARLRPCSSKGRRFGWPGRTRGSSRQPDPAESASSSTHPPIPGRSSTG